jgi:hypothetical protein
MSGKPKVYVETTDISYLTAWPSAEVVTAAHQQITKEWWQTQRDEFDLFVSELVVREAQVGDSEAARLRLDLIAQLNLLALNDAATELAESISSELHLPDRASADALHIALSVVHGMDYLITWNCRHIANARHRQRIADICDALGYVSPVICTPEELKEE